MNHGPSKVSRPTLKKVQDLSSFAISSFCLQIRKYSTYTDSYWRLTLYMQECIVKKAKKDACYNNFCFFKKFRLYIRNKKADRFAIKTIRKYFKNLKIVNKKLSHKLLYSIHTKLLRIHFLISLQYEIPKIYIR